MNQLLAMLLAVLLIFCVAAPALAVEPTAENESPVIFMAGFISTDTVDLRTGEKVFPPTAKSIMRGLRDTVQPVMNRVLKGEFRALDYPLNQVLLALLDGIRCDENGDPVRTYTSTIFTYPDPEEIRAKYHEGVGYFASDYIYYSYDWRQDMRTLADGLHDFIEYVLDATGAKTVDLIGYSMGACVLSAYLAVYGTEYLDAISFYCGAFNGSAFCGDAFKNDIDMDPDSTVAFINGFAGYDLEGEIVKTLVDLLHQKGMTDVTVAVVKRLVRSVFASTYRQALRYIFGRMPGFWAMMPYDDFDYVRNEFANGIVTDAFYEKVDFYHDVQAKIPALIEDAMQKGVAVSIVTKYGYPNVPLVASRNENSDAIVDLKYASIGATAADYNTTFPVDYTQAVPGDVNYLSPDRTVDASTCAFPEYTWFMKNTTHIQLGSINPTCEVELFDYLFGEGRGTTVHNDVYPQFLVKLPDASVVPLTGDTDYSAIGDYHRSESFLVRIKRIFEDYKLLLQELFALIKK